MNTDKTLIDAFSLLDATSIPCLDDGFVRLEDCMPRLIPKGRSLEIAAVKSARISYGQDLKSPEVDAALVRYLIRNGHTSPLESIKFTFHIRAPKFVTVQIMRHRTANVNEFSQRYSQIRENRFYHPSRVDTASSSNVTPISGIRFPSSVNKQGSVNVDTNDEETQNRVNKIRDKLVETEALLDRVYGNYTELIELGLVKEVARFCLPTAMYTEFYFTMDLNNLLKFLGLRMDRAHAQLETVVYADAIAELIRPLVPIAIETFMSWRVDSLVLSGPEVAAIAAGSKTIPGSAGANREFQEKRERLHLNLQIE